MEIKEILKENEYRSTLLQLGRANGIAAVERNTRTFDIDVVIKRTVWSSNMNDRSNEICRRDAYYFFTRC